MLPDVGLRIDHEAGRVVWSVEGQEFTKHYYPPNLPNCEFSVHGLISEMDYAGIEMAFLHTNPMLGERQRISGGVRRPLSGTTGLDGARGRVAHPG